MSVRSARIELVDDHGVVHTLELEKIESYNFENEIVTVGNPTEDFFVTLRATKVTVTIVGFRK